MNYTYTEFRNLKKRLRRFPRPVLQPRDGLTALDYVTITVT